MLLTVVSLAITHTKAVESLSNYNPQRDYYSSDFYTNPNQQDYDPLWYSKTQQQGSQVAQQAQTSDIQIAKDYTELDNLTLSISAPSSYKSEIQSKQKPTTDIVAQQNQAKNTFKNGNGQGNSAPASQSVDLIQQNQQKNSYPNGGTTFANNYSSSGTAISGVANIPNKNVDLAQQNSLKSNQNQQTSGVSSLSINSGAVSAPKTDSSSGSDVVLANPVKAGYNYGNGGNNPNGSANRAAGNGYDNSNNWNQNYGNGNGITSGVGPTSVISPSIGTSGGSTTCNCAQINSDIANLQISVGSLSTAVNRNLQDTMSGIATQLSKLKSQTSSLISSQDQQDAKIANLQNQVSTLSLNGVSGGNGGGSSIQATLEYIRNQGYLEISSRWRIGSAPNSNGNQNFYIIDQLSGGSQPNFYLFKPGQGPVTIN